MTTFTIELTEVLSRLVTIDARNEAEAFAIVEKCYRDGELILTADDFQERTIEAFRP